MSNSIKQRSRNSNCDSSLKIRNEWRHLRYLKQNLSHPRRIIVIDGEKIDRIIETGISKALSQERSAVIQCI